MMKPALSIGSQCPLTSCPLPSMAASPVCLYWNKTIASEKRCPGHGFRFSPLELPIHLVSPFFCPFTTVFSRSLGSFILLYRSVSWRAVSHRGSTEPRSPIFIGLFSICLETAHCVSAAPRLPLDSSSKVQALSVNPVRPGQHTSS